VQMNLALSAPPSLLVPALRAFQPTSLVVLYHDAGALALDGASQASLALAATLIADADLPQPSTAP
jgi:hypothetical protein